MDPARLQLEPGDGVAVARIAGEIDMSNAIDLRQAIISPLSNEILALIVDLSDVTYLDSAAIRVIFDVRDRLASRGQALWLVVPPGALIADALRVAGVLGVVAAAETLDEARRRSIAPADADDSAYRGA